MSAKPILTGFCANFIKKVFYGNVIVTTAIGAGWWFGVLAPRRKLYNNFYNNYSEADARKDFEEMRALGVFRSAPRDGEEMEEW